MLIGMAASSSRGSRGKAPIVDGEADWRICDQCISDLFVLLHAHVINV
jgi:hypothetical protein